MAKIGIRLADGKFYPILDEGDAVKKRLVLTTVKDDQSSVQIDVYRDSDEVRSERAYVGSLVIENIPARPKGEPDIRLDIGLDAEGNLTAYAKELASGEHQALSVSLKSLSEEEKYEIPDFDFQEDDASLMETDEFPDMNPFDENPEEVEPAETPVTRVKDTYSFDEEPVEPEPASLVERKRKRPVIVPILLALAATLLVLAIAFLVFRCTADRQPAPPV
ncbi:MAG: hypothetical protein E4H20_12360, partial [Spirochaetales bacterium]